MTDIGDHTTPIINDQPEFTRQEELVIKQEEEQVMAENGYWDPTFHTEHASIRHDVGLAEANIRDKIGEVGCGLEQSIGETKYAVGYVADKNLFIVKNSFGVGWGEGGYGYMHTDYVKLHVFDKWTFDVCIEEDTCQVT